MSSIPPTPPPEDLPTPIAAVDRLLTIYRSPGPYASVFMTLGDTVEGRFDRRVLVVDSELRDQEASEAARNAVQARLGLPAPDDVAGVAVIAADDGTTVVDYAHEPPVQDHIVVDALPHAAPLLEWDQRRIPHLVLTVDEEGADIAMFGLDHFTRLERLDADLSVIVDRTASAATALSAELVIVTGAPACTATLVDALVTSVRPTCRVIAEPPHDDVDALVDATVRHVSDAVARRTMAMLVEHRFLDEHDAAVDGRSDTIAELVDGTASVLLLHDRWIDQERIWIGEEPRELSTTDQPGHRSARLNDALIWSAVRQGIPVHIIPSTGPNGPDDDTGAIVDQSPQYTT